VLRQQRTGEIAGRWATGRSRLLGTERDAGKVAIPAGTVSSDRCHPTQASAW